MKPFSIAMFDLVAMLLQVGLHSQVPFENSWLQ